MEPSMGSKQNVMNVYRKTFAIIWWFIIGAQLCFVIVTSCDIHVIQKCLLYCKVLQFSALRILFCVYVEYLVWLTYLDIVSICLINVTKHEQEAADGS